MWRKPESMAEDQSYQIIIYVIISRWGFALFNSFLAYTRDIASSCAAWLLPFDHNKKKKTRNKLYAQQHVWMCMHVCNVTIYWKIIYFLYYSIRIFLRFLCTSSGMLTEFPITILYMTGTLSVCRCFFLLTKEKWKKKSSISKRFCETNENTKKNENVQKLFLFNNWTIMFSRSFSNFFHRLYFHIFIIIIFEMWRRRGEENKSYQPEIYLEMLSH